MKRRKSKARPDFTIGEPGHQSKRKINFLHPEEIDAWLYARKGFSNEAIGEKLGISPGMAQYRVSMAQHALGLEPRQYARRAYRNGQSVEARRAMRVSESERVMIRRTVAPRLIKVRLADRQ